MLLRLLLALVIALSPMQAMAAPACHVPPEPAAHAHHQPAPEQPARAPADLCIGCVAPASLPAPALGAPLAFDPPILLESFGTGIARAALPPATPPPKPEA